MSKKSDGNLANRVREFQRFLQRKGGDILRSHEIQIKDATLKIPNVEGRDGTVIFDETVAAHILRSNGGIKLSVYVHDKRAAC
ncbi:MAG: hypothetical protein ACXADC_08935 [Candidatus Thorarchaeota archaeon]